MTTLLADQRPSQVYRRRPARTRTSQRLAP